MIKGKNNMDRYEEINELLAIIKEIVDIREDCGVFYDEEIVEGGLSNVLAFSTNNICDLLGEKHEQVTVGTSEEILAREVGVWYDWNPEEEGTSQPKGLKSDDLVITCYTDGCMSEKPNSVSAYRWTWRGDYTDITAFKLVEHG